MHELLSQDMVVTLLLSLCVCVVLVDGEGAHAENTIEAMQALLERDNGPEGPVPALHYVEVDIQVHASWC